MGKAVYQKPNIFHSIQWYYTALLITTPLFVWSVLLSAGYIFVIKQKRQLKVHKLATYPPQQLVGVSI